VALYFENSILAPDLKLLPSAAAIVRRAEKVGSKWSLDSPNGVGMAWKGSALVDGKPWPLTDGSTVWLPAGAHTLEGAPAGPETRILDFNGDLQSAEASSGGDLQLSYQSSGRAIAILEKKPSALKLDGREMDPEMLSSGPNWALLLPRGRHAAEIQFHNLTAAVPQP
jgi:hypothetical protein